MYGIKIDKRKKATFNDVIRKCIEENKIWCDENEGDYVDKKFAKKFDTYEDADYAITEKWEMVSKL